MQGQDYTSLVRAVDRVARVLAVALAERAGDTTQAERIRMLRLCGFGAVEIAGILGTTKGTVSVALAKAKRASGGKRGKAGRRAVH